MIPYSILAALEDGSAHIVQSALSQGFASLNKGETPPAVHFAQINEMDGFFLTGRAADPAFTWNKKINPAPTDERRARAHPAV